MNLLLQVSILWVFNKFYSVFNIWNEFTALSMGFGVYWRIAEILCLPLFVVFAYLLNRSHFRTSRTELPIAKSLIRLPGACCCSRHCLQPTSLCLTTSSHVKIAGCGHAHVLLHWNPQLPLTAPWLVRWIIFHQLM